jgi:hypothetical protein
MKRLALSVSLALAVIGGPCVVVAQTENGAPPAEVPFLAPKEKRVKALLEETFYASRTPEIYADLRYAFGELYLPIMKERLNDPMPPEVDASTLEKLRLFIPLAEAGLRAAKELEPILEESRQAMFSEAAAILSKYMVDDEIAMAEKMLRTPAAHKSFNVVYAFSRLITGYSSDDIRQSQALSEWMRGLKFDFKQNPFGDQNAPPPPRDRVIKAEAIVADFIRISRIDDIVADIARFIREVPLQVDTLQQSEKDNLANGLQQFEFFYNLGKSMAVAVMPSGLASILNEEQLGQFHIMILSPVMSKSFGLLHNVVREATSYTKQDITEMRALAEEADKLKAPMSDEKKAQMDAEWQALAGKWGDRLMNSLSPDTRAALETALADFSAMIEEERRKNEVPTLPGQPGDPTRPDQRDL